MKKLEDVAKRAGLTPEEAAEAIIDAAPRRKEKRSGRPGKPRRDSGDADDERDDERRADDKPKRGFWSELWSDDE